MLAASCSWAAGAAHASSVAQATISIWCVFIIFDLQKHVSKKICVSELEHGDASGPERESGAELPCISVGIGHSLRTNRADPGRTDYARLGAVKLSELTGRL